MQKIIFTLFAISSIWNISARQSDEAAKRALEREVKTSGNFVYGESIANTKEEAVEFAKNALVFEINREISNNPNWQFAKTIQAKDVEYVIEMIDLMRVNKFRVIAYVKKENLMAVFQDNRSPDIELSDKTAQTIPSPPSLLPLPIPTTIQTVEAAALATMPEKPLLSVPEPTPGPPMGGNRTTAVSKDDILGQIVNAPSLGEIQTILVDNKNRGKAAYGTMDKLIHPDAAYFIVYKRTGEIVAILDKGSSRSKTDLISGATFGNEIFNNNQVLWFQLFNN